MKKRLIENSISNREIVSYWTSRQDECGLGVDWADAHERCWRCGYKARLQRCHIIPEARKGRYSPDNLVLLRRRCHREAPNIADARYIWIWLRATSLGFYNLHICARAVLEFEMMFGRKPFVHPSFKNVEAMYAEVEQILGSTIIHYGEGRTNAATLACAFAQLEEKYLGVAPKPCNNSWFLQYLFFGNK